MSEMELKLLGLNTNDEFAHKGYTYKNNEFIKIRIFTDEKIE